MEWSSLSLKDGIGFLFAGVLMKILYDLCYRTIPAAFSKMNSRLEKLEGVANTFLADHKHAMATMTTLAEHVENAKICVPRVKRHAKKKNRRASPADKPRK